MKLIHKSKSVTTSHTLRTHNNTKLENGCEQISLMKLYNIFLSEIITMVKWYKSSTLKMAWQHLVLASYGFSFTALHVFKLSMTID